VTSEGEDEDRERKCCDEDEGDVDETAHEDRRGDDGVEDVERPGDDEEKARDDEEEDRQEDED
jgi:hypothetical protein